MSEKRLRMIAGPNGSGKSTITDKLKENYNIGIYINADDIEKQIRDEGKIRLSDFQLDKQVGDRFNSFMKNHTLFKKAEENNCPINLQYTNAEIIGEANINSYGAALVADFLRDQLIEQGKNVSFETVMSHASKIEILKKAQALGYKNYLYFISTADPEINKSRVKLRVKQNGHAVPDEKIEERYYNSLLLLREAIPYTYRTFVFDNTGEESILVLDIFQAETLTQQSDEIPLWVDKYVFQP